MSEKYAFWVTLRPQSDRCCQGEAKVHILDFKTTWLELKKPCQTAAVQGKAEQNIYNLKRISPPQNLSQALCALAHLGCTRAAGTS